MSFTDLITVRKHLIGSAAPARDVTALPVQLSGVDPVPLPDANLVESGETVKWLVESKPVADGPIDMTGTSEIALSESHLVPNSVVVTIDDNLGTVYIEQIDYRIDYIDGTISRVATGQIPDGQPVYVYYEKYDLFFPDTDYLFDAVEGTLRRTAGSSIPDGATVLIDYTVPEGSVEDILIEQAILEAEDVIVRSLSSEYSSSSTDQGLETGATALALSISARALAAGTLLTNRSTDAPQRSAQWQRLAELWEAKAWETLAPFVDPNALRSPVVQ